MCTLAAETVTVHLVAVHQPRLDDAITAADLIEQAVHIGDHVVVDIGDVLGEDGAESRPPKPGSGSTGSTR